jgi:hypothetical protein
MLIVGNFRATPLLRGSCIRVRLRAARKWWAVAGSWRTSLRLGTGQAGRPSAGSFHSERSPSHPAGAHPGVRFDSYHHLLVRSSIHLVRHRHTHRADTGRSRNHTERAGHQGAWAAGHVE